MKHIALFLCLLSTTFPTLAHEFGPNFNIESLFEENELIPDSQIFPVLYQNEDIEVIDSERSLLELQLLHRRAAADAWQQRITIQSIANQPLLNTFNATQSHE